VSVELWDRHFLPGERRTVNIHVFNDREGARSGNLRWGVVGAGELWGPDVGAARSGGGADTADLWIGKTEGRMEVSVAGVDSLVVPVEIAFPEEPGRYEVRAELADGGPSARQESGGALHGAGAGSRADGPAAVSRKCAHVIGVPTVPERLQRLHPGVLEERGEILHYLHSVGIEARDLGSSKCSECDAILVADGLARGGAFRRHIAELESYLATGGSVVLIEPEYGVETEATVPVGHGISFHILRRADADRGGYDSCVFMDDPSHPLWRGIRREHLQFFNGATGGEIVSQHDVTCSVPMGVLARCGLKCGTVAAAEVEAGPGTVVLSRLQIRGRLVASRESGTLYGRRPDPVAQRYLLNLLETYGRRHGTT
jgi:hypothetical protein